MRERLTKQIVDGLKSGAKDFIVWDRDLIGFGLKVTPTGKKVYFAFYRTTSGKQRKPAIGLHGKVTTEQARQVARKWLAAAIFGHDISADRQEARAALLVRDLAQKYLDDYAACFKKPSSYNTDKSNLNNHVLPLIGTKKVSEVCRADIEEIKIAIKDGRTAARRKAKFRGRSNITGGPGVANRTVSLLSKMMGCAVDWGMRFDNPALRIKKFPEHRKNRFLDTDEIRRLLRVLELVSANGTESIHTIVWLRLLLFTGLRLGEVRDMYWNDIDLARGTLNLRDSKTGARIVPLNDQVTAVLQKHLVTKVDQFVIQSSIGIGRPALGKPWQRIRNLAGIDDTANIHCLRHTFASWAVMGGLSLAQTGALLGHKSTQTTLRYADHLTEAVRGYSQRAANMIAGE